MFGIFDKITEFIKDILMGVIHSNLQSMFIDINEKVELVANEVAKSPMSFNNHVFSFIKNINDSLVIPIATMIITAVLCVELINLVMQKNNMHDVENFQFFKYIIKMWVAIWFVTHAFDFAMATFDVAQNLIGKATGIINTNAVISNEEILTMVEALKERGIGELLVIVIETSIVKLLVQGISILIVVITYGRMFEIYAYCSISSIPFATMGNREWGSIGNNYIKGLFALGLQGLFLIICLGIYAVLVKTINIDDIHRSIFLILGYTILLGLMMFKSGSLAKSILNAH